LSKGFLNWLIFIALSVIWGSSFVLMKEGLKHLSAYQVASLRIVSSGMVLLPAAVKCIKNIPKNKLWIIVISGTLGNLLPAYLFCIAEEGIDSALAGTLNSLTPIFVIITGAVIFKTYTNYNKVAGIVISFAGSIFLLCSKGSIPGNQNLIFIGYVVLATVLYGYNVNMVQRHLKDTGSLQIAAVALTLNALPAFVILVLTGYFKLPLLQTGILQATGAAFLLGIVGTAIATIIFYMLVKRAGGIFASMVTYGIPVVANVWGVIYHEEVGWKQVSCLAIILLGVYVANRKVAENKQG
jgi:drug/metabolite transporter (DMT)-like permease